jgi:hypothetical protein
MMFTVEIVPKGRDYAVAETVVHEGREPDAWTDEDVAGVLREILRAIDRAANPGADDRPVTLRGFSWIVEPSGDEVVIAIEIPSGAAVAGPFAVEPERLSAMIARVVAAADSPGPGSPRVH